jgi:hypothetical protein
VRLFLSGDKKQIGLSGDKKKVGIA